MNLQDCIDIIKNCTTLACEYHIKDKCDYGYEVREERFECAKRQAINALEKQIPKKPAGLYRNICPNCNGIVNVLNGEKFCYNCGQRLSWEVADEE